jgi:hypothetical protein
MDEPAGLSFMPQGFMESPIFIVAVILLLIGIAVLLRVAYSNNAGEYRHDPDKE